MEGNLYGNRRWQSTEFVLNTMIFWHEVIMLSDPFDLTISRGTRTFDDVVGIYTIRGT